MSARHSPAAIAVRGEGAFQQHVSIGGHRITADEPLALGGLDTGPTPYDLLTAALATCTAMTLVFYANRNGVALPPFRVEVRHQRVHAQDCADCANSDQARVDRFERRILFDSPIDEATSATVARIANKCPVDLTLKSPATVATSILVEEGTPPGVVA